MKDVNQLLGVIDWRLMADKRRFEEEACRGQNSIVIERLIDWSVEGEFLSNSAGIGTYILVAINLKW